MNSTENRSHQPKGGMCMSCAKWREDCSGLPFATMPVMSTTTSGVKVVRCTEHVRVQTGLPEIEKRRDTWKQS